MAPAVLPSSDPELRVAVGSPLSTGWTTTKMDGPQSLRHLQIELEAQQLLLLEIEATGLPAGPFLRDGLLHIQ